MARLLKENDARTGAELLRLIAERTKAVEALAATPHLRHQRDTMQQGGYMYAILGFPYQIDADFWLRNKTPLCGRVLEVGGKPQLLVRETGHAHSVKVSALADEKNLKVIFTYPEYRKAELGEDKLNFYIEDASGKICRFQAWLVPTRVFSTHVVKDSTANGGQMEVLMQHAMAKEKQSCSLDSPFARVFFNLFGDRHTVDGDDVNGEADE